MRYENVWAPVGEGCGPIDWDHPIANGMPSVWREAEKNPTGFVFTEYRRTILRICMYDGWPYWKPMPAVQFIGPLNSAEWSFFNSYGVHADSIQPRPAQQATTPASAEGTEAAQVVQPIRDEP